MATGYTLKLDSGKLRIRISLLCSSRGTGRFSQHKSYLWTDRRRGEDVPKSIELINLRQLQSRSSMSVEAHYVSL